MIKLATCPESDECLSPRYVVEPIVPFIMAKGFKNIWCPFDKETSMFVRIFREIFQKNMELGGRVWNNHKDIGGNFFNFDKDFIDYLKIDCLVSNPPFSLKDKVLKKLFELGKPFAMLMPITALGGKKRQEMFKKYGIEVLFLGERTGFYTQSKISKGFDEKGKEIFDYVWDNEAYSKIKENTAFESCYICHNLLPEKIMYATMNKKQEPYNVEI